MQLKVTSGSDSFTLRCDLRNASNRIEINTGSGWRDTQYQAADVRHSRDSFIQLAKEIAVSRFPTDDVAEIEVCEV
jgi:hypothetical protein